MKVEDKDSNSEDPSEKEVVAIEKLDPEKGASGEKPMQKSTKERAGDISTGLKIKTAEIKRFVHEHSKGIALGFATLLAIGSYVLCNEREKSQLRDKIANLSEDLKTEREVSDALAGELVEERNRSELKDKYFDEMISEGLRKGSSLAGHHMVEKRQYLKEISESSEAVA